MIDRSPSRRRFLAGAAASPFIVSGLSAPARAAGLTIGIIYVGSRADYGWNQAHAVAAKALKEISGINVVEEENVPETAAVQKTMESMINIDGATLLHHCPGRGARSRRAGTAGAAGIFRRAPN